MKVGLIQIDGKLPNHALLKLQKWHEDKGDEVVYIDLSSFKCDRFYGSKIFMGGSGYDIKASLPEEIEAVVPDFEKFNKDFSIGYTTRGCIRDCGFCIVREKEGQFREVGYNWIKPDSKVILYDNNFLASEQWKEKLQYFIDNNVKVSFNQGLDIRLIDKEKAEMLYKVKYYDSHFKDKRIYFSFDFPQLENIVIKNTKLLLDIGFSPKHILYYILVGYNTTLEEDLKRIEIVKSLSCIPFVMIYNNRKDKPLLRYLAKYVNKRYHAIISWEDFKNNKYHEPKINKETVKYKSLGNY